MIFDFYPWKIDIDVEATKQLYVTNDYANDKNINNKFYNSLSEKQKQFFDSIGVDTLKIQAEEKIHDLSEEEEATAEKIYIGKFNFLIKGLFLAIPDYQKDLYGDDELFGDKLPDSLNTVSTEEEDGEIIFDIDGLACIFKHPCFSFDGDEFKEWDCEYVLGSILIMKEV